MILLFKYRYFYKFHFYILELIKMTELENSLNNINNEESNNSVIQEQLYNFYDYISKDNNSVEIEQELKQMAYDLPLNIKVLGVDLLSITIFFQNIECFDILMSRGININTKILKGENMGMTPILWAINNNNNYMLDKLLNRVDLNLFCQNIIDKNNEYSNIITQVVEYINDIEVFKKILNNMLNISKEETIKYINYNRYNLIKLCIDNYTNNLDKELMFEKIDYILTIDNSIIENIKNVTVFNDFLTIYKNKSIQNILLELYLHVRKYFKLKIYYDNIFIGVVIDNFEFIKLVCKDKIYDPFYLIKNIETVVKNDKRNIIDYFIKKINKNNIEEIFSENKNCIYYCIENDNIDLFKYLYNNEIIYKDQEIYYDCNIKKIRLLHVACKYSAVNIILFLLETGENLLYEGNCKITPLRYGIINNISTLTMNIISAEYKDLNYYFKDNKKKTLHEHCSICLDDIYSKDIVKLECGHSFHKECFLKNIKNSHNCCYCRTPINVNYYVSCKLGTITNKNKNKNLNLNLKKRSKSCSDIIVFKKQNKLNLKNIDNLEIELFDKNKFIENEFQKMKNDLERIKRLNNLKKIYNMLMTSKYISKKNKKKQKFNENKIIPNNPPNTPIKKKRIYKSEVEKLKEINGSMNVNINEKRKTRNKQPDRYGY